MKEIILVAHNIRSTHNVGAILRTADAFAVSKVIVSGYTPYPHVENDPRLPHIASKNTKDIAKTALGAEKSMTIEVSNDILKTLEYLKNSNYRILGLEQDDRSLPLSDYQMAGPTALIIGEERYGIEQQILERCDDVVELPMLGKKESLNVGIATGICLYQLRMG